MWEEERMSRDERELVADRIWGEITERLPAAELTRVRGLLDVWTGRAEPKPHHGQDMQGKWFMPDLPSTAWMDRAAFEPLATTLESLCPELRREILEEERAGGFRPYGYTAEAPDLRQEWVPAGWDELRLWEDFLPTLNVLRLPVASRALHAITASTTLVNHVAFLAMKPGTHLPVHHDRTNWYVSIHLGIIVPPGCVLRVAGEDRSWEEDKCLFFDNSFAHEAWNKGESRRIILSVYLSHPLTTATEREALKLLQSRYRSLAMLNYDATIAWARSGRLPSSESRAVP